MNICSRRCILKAGSIILVQGLNAHPYYTWVGRSPSREAQLASGTPRPWYKKLQKLDQITRNKESEDESRAEIFWPRDLLPQHLGPSRIATYSYLSNWRSPNFKTDIRECGEQLLNILCQHRGNEASNKRHMDSLRSNLRKAEGRPIVLIGHSLGGIVIQQASSTLELPFII